MGTAGKEPVVPPRLMLLLSDRSRRRRGQGGEREDDHAQHRGEEPLAPERCPLPVHHAALGRWPTSLVSKTNDAGPLCRSRRPFRDRSRDGPSLRLVPPLALCVPLTLLLAVVIGDQRIVLIHLAVVGEARDCSLRFGAQVFLVFERLTSAPFIESSSFSTGASGTASKVLRIPLFGPVSSLPLNTTRFSPFSSATRAGSL